MSKPPLLPRGLAENLLDDPQVREAQAKLQKFIKQFDDSPQLRNLRTTVAEISKQFDNPLLREQARAATEKLQKQIDRLGARDATEELQKQLDSALRGDTPKRTRRRRKGGGRKFSLTQAEIAKLQKAFRRWRKDNPNIKQENAIKHMLPLLPEKKRSLSLSTFARHIFRPVLAKVRVK